MPVRRQIAQPPTTAHNGTQRCTAELARLQRRKDAIELAKRAMIASGKDWTRHGQRLQGRTAARQVMPIPHASTTAVSTRHHSTAAAHRRCTKHGRLRAGNTDDAQERTAAKRRKHVTTQAAGKRTMGVSRRKRWGKKAPWARHALGVASRKAHSGRTPPCSTKQRVRHRTKLSAACVQRWNKGVEEVHAAARTFLWRSLVEGHLNSRERRSSWVDHHTFAGAGRTPLGNQRARHASYSPRVRARHVLVPCMLV
jgi:hypothetical protein